MVVSHCIFEHRRHADRQTHSSITHEAADRRKAAHDQENNVDFQRENLVALTPNPIPFVSLSQHVDEYHELFFISDIETQLFRLPASIVKHLKLCKSARFSAC